jgi:hypothetical protein
MMSAPAQAEWLLARVWNHLGAGSGVDWAGCGDVRIGEVQPDSAVWSSVKALFSSPGGRSLARIELIENNDLDMMCTGALRNCNRRCASPPNTNSSSPWTPTKRALLDALEARYVTEALGLPLSHAHVAWLWYPCKANGVYSIAKSGLSNFASSGEDEGRFGFGRYLSMEALHACKLSRDIPGPHPGNSRGHWCVVLCLVVLGATRPILPCEEDFEDIVDHDFGAQCSVCKHQDQPVRAPFDSHVVPVRLDVTEFVATSVETAEFHEVVVNQDSQILPIAIVWFK